MKHVVFWVSACLLAAGSAAYAGTISGKVLCTGVRSSANAVVYVARIEGKSFPAPKHHAVLNQKAKVFVPYVLPVLVGTTVDFVNGDGFAHNVFTPDDCAGKFNLGAWVGSEVRSYTFAKPCQAVMLCKLHPEMTSYVIVLETPYFAVSKEDGSYSIAEVPDGTYEVAIWHERFKKQTSTVTVRGQTTVDFTLRR
jgi:plastocyanin